MYHVGIDIGSTTAKLAVLNERQDVVFSTYRRHHAEIQKTFSVILKEALALLGDIDISICITGSAGMGISERHNIPFVQEVIASAEAARTLHPQGRTLIDVGGEDSKMIFFQDNSRPDIRMNSNCAGGTGAFIDQMASLIDITIGELDSLATQYRHRYPIASRCGVFAKTDIQNLISRQIPKEDIAASILYAVALQTKNTLERGNHVNPKVIFSGGPLTYLPSLRKAFQEVFHLKTKDILLPEESLLLPAIGAAIIENSDTLQTTCQALVKKVNNLSKHNYIRSTSSKPLFKTEEELKLWLSTRMKEPAIRIPLKELEDSDCFLGVDSGSTTTKLIIIDNKGRIAFEYYTPNLGDPIEAVSKGLEKLSHYSKQDNVIIKIARSAVTGYGEDLIRVAFELDDGIVETIAHYYAAKTFRKDVSFILDIGGQDMKAIFIENGFISNIVINEACSSGCGSFIQTFADSLGYSIEDFAQLACKSSSPYDLGSRCTVFMNSKVKQSLKDGADVPDIAAGLAYSIVKNCLQKVLRIQDTDILGNNIIVQGGTFRNPAVHKALEILLGKEVICSNIPEFMGAYGAALSARDVHYKMNKLTDCKTVPDLCSSNSYTQKSSYCYGCSNRCMVTTMTFKQKNRYFTGNKCEKIYSNSGKINSKGSNLAELKNKLLFERSGMPDCKPRMTIGIPRVLNMYENFPFWNSLLVECGFQVVLSPPSTAELSEKGTGTVMSDNICFPAKLVHGHIMSLLESKIDRIFYPMVFYEKNDSTKEHNCWNCPIVAAYPDVIRSSINPEKDYGIPFGSPTVSFKDISLLKKSCYTYLHSLGINWLTFQRAFKHALLAQKQFTIKLKQAAESVLLESSKNNRPLIILAARPYHLDPLINHKIPEMISDLGVDVLIADAISDEIFSSIENAQVLTQWSYPNRLYRAARWIKFHPKAELIQLNSFGCGPDAIALEEVKEMLAVYKKHPTVLRIDEMTSQGAIKLRIRSLIETMVTRDRDSYTGILERKTTRSFNIQDKRRIIIVPYFSQFYSSFIAEPFKKLGYTVEVLSPTDKESMEIGLRYINNEICYPAILVIGDIIKALQSGRYNISNVAVGLTQTGGQCRASNYIALLKKALVVAGFEDIPVVSLSISGKKQNEQPGFNIDMKNFLSMGLSGILLGDALARMYYATAAREESKGEAKKVLEKYTTLSNGSTNQIFSFQNLDILRSAATDFNRIKSIREPYIQIGIVGEIYVKYNSFSNNFLLDWLVDNHIEIELPPMLDMFVHWFVNVEENPRLFLEKKNIVTLLARLGERIVQSRIEEVEEVLSEFKYYKPLWSIHKLAEKASRILSLADQFGEGWLIPAEISYLAEHGIQNVICLQPFGCIANHIVAKGVEKRMRDLYPFLHLLFLDLDYGSVEANLLNRLLFMIHNINGKPRLVNSNN